MVFEKHRVGTEEKRQPLSVGQFPPRSRFVGLSFLTQALLILRCVMLFSVSQLFLVTFA